MKWIDLARVYHGRSDGAPFRNVLDLALKAVASGAIVFPLSSTHYVETLKRRDLGARSRLGETMAALSRFDTLADGHVILDHELRQALSKHFGGSVPVGELRLLGRGHNHAFGHPDGNPYQPQGSPLWLMHEEMKLAGMLSTHLDAARAESAEVLAPFVEALHRRDRFDSRYRVTDDERRRLIRIGLLQEQLPRVARILQEANPSKELCHSLPSDWYWELFDELSVLVVDLELQNARRANQELPRLATDIFDMGTLSAAIVYSGLVVTERYWTHVARSTGLDSRFGTVVLSRLQDLEPALEEAIAAA